MNSRQGTGLIHAQRPRPNAWGAPQPTVTPQEVNRNDSTTILQTTETTTNKPTENHNPRRFIHHKNHTYVENQSRKSQWHDCNAKLPSPTPASIGHFSHDSPGIRINTGLAGRHAGNPRKQWASGQVTRKRPIYAGLRPAVKNAHQPITGYQFILMGRRRSTALSASQIREFPNNRQTSNNQSLLKGVTSPTTPTCLNNCDLRLTLAQQTALTATQDKQNGTPLVSFPASFPSNCPSAYKNYLVIGKCARASNKINNACHFTVVSPWPPDQFF